MSDMSRTSDEQSLGNSSPNASTGNVPTSHPTGFWFFFWGEFAERCSYYGMRAILSLYMVERLGVDKADAGTYMSLFMAACYFLPIAGGLIADKFLGKYWTIVGFSLPYIVGQVMVGIEDKTIVAISLGLLAMGSGVIKPNISTLMGLTYDQQRPGQEQLRTSAFSWFYLAINTGAFLSMFGMPILRKEFGYKAAFILPAVLMSIALFIFAIGKKYYAVETIGKAAARNDEEDATSKANVLKKIGALFTLVIGFWAIFDQSASTWIFFADTYMDGHMFGLEVSADQIQSYNSLFIVIFLPMCVLLFKSLAKAGYNIRATDKMIAGFLCTMASMVIMSYAGFTAGKARKMVQISSLNGSIITELPSVEFAKIEGAQSINFGDASNFSINSSNWSYNPQNKKISFSSGTITIAGKSWTIENGIFQSDDVTAPETRDTAKVPEFNLKPRSDEKIKSALEKTKDQVVTLTAIDYVNIPERVTVWWQVLAYLILTFGEILISVTGLELAFVVAPKSMKGFVTACWLATNASANLLVNAPITRLYPHMDPGVYFAMLAAGMLVATSIMVYVAKNFNK